MPQEHINTGQTQHHRLHNLDYLRGLAAFGIMIYHYLTWASGEFLANTFIGRLGIYGVSIFYILSGLTLYYVYYDSMKPSKEDIISFFRKRVFRIFPLLWLVTILSILFSRKNPNLIDVILNLSGLFGFVSWDRYLSVGAWSIGNEIVFYAFFPFFILFIKKIKPLMFLLSLTIFGLYLYFAFVKLNLTTTLSKQWSIYVNPLNQVFLFLSGFLIGFFLNNTKINQFVIILLLLISLGVFIYYPATGNQVTLVTGVNRLTFTTSCFLICICFYKLPFQFPNFIHKPLALLGEVSYSVYLLHPIVYDLVGRIRNHTFFFSESLRLTSALIITLIISYYTYQYFEKYFTRLGRRIA